MTRASQDGNKAELRDALSHGLRTMAVATVFGALALFALAGPLGMFFSGGDKQDGVMLAQTLTILALSTPFMSANFMMSRVFYANEDARTPFYIQLLLAVVYVAGAFAIQFLPVGQVIYAIAILYMVGNILSVVISAYFLRRLLGHLDGPRIANSYIRMGYAGLGSAVAGAGALWLMGSYSPDGFAWSDRLAALVTVIVVGPVMLVAYLFLLKVFHVSELRDLLRPLLGRLGRTAGPDGHRPGDPAVVRFRGSRPRNGTYDAGTRHGLGGHRPHSPDFRRVRCRLLPGRSRAGSRAGTRRGSCASRGCRWRVRGRLPSCRGRARHSTGRPAPR